MSESRKLAEQQAPQPSQHVETEMDKWHREMDIADAVEAARKEWNIEMEQKIAALKAQLASEKRYAKEEMESVTAELEAMRKRYDEESLARVSLLSKKRELEEENAQLKEDLKQLEERFDKSQLEIARLHSQITSLNQEK